MSTAPNEKAPANPLLEELLHLLELMRPPEPKGKPTKSLLGAVYASDPELLKVFLAAGGNPNQANQYGSVLSTAVARGNLAILNLLIGAGARNAGGQLPRAAERGDLAIMRRLFELGVDVEKDGGPALATAAYHNQVEAVKLLLEKGVSVAFENYRAVSEAARHASFEVLRVLFAAGVKPEHAGAALRLAAASPLAFAGVKFLVEAGVDPLRHPHYAVNSCGEPANPPFTAADAAAEANQPEVADYLRGKAVDVEALLAREEERRKEWNSNNLDEAIREERQKKTAHLLRGPARSEASRRALSLIQAPSLKSSLSQPGSSGHTALGVAAANGDPELVSALLDQGADPNQVDWWQCPPLLAAAGAGHTHIVEMLLQAGADPNGRGHNQGAALIEAADWDDPAMVKALLDAGADPKAEDVGGRTPMNVEHGLQGAEIKTLLRRAVRQGLGDKSEKGQGLSFVRGKGKVDLAGARGVQEFRRVYYESQAAWSVLAVRAPLDEVMRVHAELAKPVRVEKDVAKRKVGSARRYVYLLQLKDSPWSLVLHSLGFLSEADLRAAHTAARELSRDLKTRAYAYFAEDTSGAESYELYDQGESVEKATQCERIEFESRLRARPEFNAELFPDPVFAEEDIFLPACYPKDDGYELKLVLEGLQRGDLGRVDLMVLEE